MREGEKLRVVRLGDAHFPADEWLAAFNQVFEQMLDRQLAGVQSDRQLLRAVRDLKCAKRARECQMRAAELVIRSGTRLNLDDSMEVVAVLPGMSDPPAKVGVD